MDKFITMYFYKKKGKQHLDFTGNLILSHNDAIIKARIKSAAPIPKNMKYVLLTGKIRKIKATLAIIRFIWGPSTALKVEDTDFKSPYKNNKCDNGGDCYGKQCGTCPER